MIKNAADKYAQAAISKECDKIRGAVESCRNVALNSASFSVGTIVGAGGLDRQAAEESLLEAALEAGLSRQEAISTIRSGLTSGQQEPRRLPESVDWEPSSKAKKSDKSKRENKIYSSREIKQLFQSLELQIAGKYDYVLNGKRLFVQFRLIDSKGKKPCMPFVDLGKDQFHMGIKGVYDSDRVIYRHDEVINEPTVIICEGEKCADLLADQGFPATTSYGGSNASSRTDWAPLFGKNTYLWPDNDLSGRKYMNAVAQKLSGHCKIKLLDVSCMPNAGDDCEQAIQLFEKAVNISGKDREGCLTVQEQIYWYLQTAQNLSYLNG